MKNSSVLSEDQKKFRKLRKILRQIEHLLLLPRELNNEEKLKVAKRAVYREQMLELNKKYQNGELLLLDSRDTTIDSEDSQFIQNISASFTENTIPEESSASLENEIDELSTKLDNIIIQEPNETKVEKPIQTEEKIEPKEKPIEEVKPKEKVKIVPTKISKPKITFDTVSVENAHEDLIVCLDVCPKAQLIVTGSRDTTIKVWRFDDKSKSCKLVHSFGGHSSPVTMVKFWPNENYKNVIENLKNQQEDNEVLIDSLPEINDEYPLVLSSSLDCSIRLWSISNGSCIKELYLYNPVNYFDIYNTSFAVGLDAGKVQFWNNLKQIDTSKSFEDTDIVTCVKLLKKESNSCYALTQSGLLKILKIKDESKLEYVKELDIFDAISSTSSDSAPLRKNFKHFDILNESKILLINDNKSYVILFDIMTKKYDFVSTNSSNYGFTNCFFKYENQLFVSAYNIDDATSTLNGRSSIYQITDEPKCLEKNEENDHSYCISTVACSKMPQQENCILIATGSSRNLKLYIVDYSNNALINRSLKVKYLKMCKQISHELDENNETDEEEEESEEQETSQLKTERTEMVESSRKYCSIQ